LGERFVENCDFSGSSKRLGLEQFSENEISLNFLDRTYRVTKEGIKLVEQKQYGMSILRVMNMI
jgi:hypothetical protein